MKYYDDEIASCESFEKMARSYSASLKEQGFLFIKLENEEFRYLVDEVFELFFKLKSSYGFMKKFMNSEEMNNLTEEQIEDLRSIFNFQKNKAFKIKTNLTKCFLNTLSLECELLYKLNLLAHKSEKISELSSLASDRLITMNKNLKIDNIFEQIRN